MSDIRVYTTGEVAKFCNVRKMTVVRWVDRGELPAHQLPGRGDRRITHKDLLAFMKKNGFPMPDALTEAGIDVLVVEDEANSANAIRRVLTNAGLKVAVAENGFSAGSMLERMRPAAVTLDLAMPGMSGLDVLAVIRSRDDLKDLKVLVISGQEQAKLDEAVAAGADDSLAKPFANHDLLAKMKKLLGLADAPG